jgi:hypothetical protein
VIPRYQTVLFVILVLASVVMGVALWQLRERADRRLITPDDSTPTQAPEVAQSQQATLLVASDADNSLLPQVQTLPLPQDPGARARVILGKLLDFYAAPDAAHPVPGGSASVAQVFLMPAQDLSSAPAPQLSGQPIAAGSKPADSPPPVPAYRPSSAQSSGPQLAIVNLTAAFAASHPSGIETETLTVMSICGTLHANLPRVTQVRFLIDGQPRATLAGHADLTRVYLTADAVPTEGAHP